MTQSYNDLTKEISSSIGKMKESIPETLQGFYQMSGAAMKGNTIDEKTKEYLALAIGVASRCAECIAFHTKALVKLGVTKQEFNEVLAVCIYMGGGPSLMYAAKAEQAFEELSNLKK